MFRVYYLHTRVQLWGQEKWFLTLLTFIHFLAKLNHQAGKNKNNKCTKFMCRELRESQCCTQYWLNRKTLETGSLHHICAPGRIMKERQFSRDNASYCTSPFTLLHLIVLGVTDRNIFFFFEIGRCGKASESETLQRTRVVLSGCGYNLMLLRPLERLCV